MAKSGELLQETRTLSVRISAASLMVIIDTLSGSLKFADGRFGVFGFSHDTRKALMEDLTQQMSRVPITGTLDDSESVRRTRSGEVNDSGGSIPQPQGGGDERGVGD